MAQARMINKRIAKSNKFAALRSDKSRVVYWMVYPWLDVKGRYSGDPQDVKEDCCPRLPYSVRQIAEAIVELNNIGLLVLYEAGGQPFIQYSRFEDFQPGIRPDREAPSSIPDPAGLAPEDRRRTPALYLNLNLKLKLNFLSDAELESDSPPAPGKPEKEKDAGNPGGIEGRTSEVLAYLNERTGKKFKSDGGHIAARLREGISIEECKRVIDVKVDDWSGSEWEDKRTPGRMVRGDDYLRPSTLFSKANFEEYRNQAPRQRRRRPGERDVEAEAELRRLSKLYRAEYDRLVAEKCGGDLMKAPTFEEWIRLRGLK